MSNQMLLLHFGLLCLVHCQDDNDQNHKRDFQVCLFKDLQEPQIERTNS